MSKSPQSPRPRREKPKQHPFRRAILRGLAIVLPPLLTIVVFIWAWNTIEAYVLKPIETGARYVVVWSIQDTRKSVPPNVDVASVEVFKDGRRMNVGQMLDELPPPERLVEEVEAQGAQIVAFRAGDTVYQALEGGSFIPAYVYQAVQGDPRDPNDAFPVTADDYFHRYARITYLRRTVVLPVFICLFVLTLYLVGKFLAAGMGRYFWTSVERAIHRLPVIRNVYSSVKQVTDFVFSEQEVEFTRVVAVEYPRRDMWSVGFVTGESMLDIRDAAAEPVVSVLMPTSPMPMTGFTITVRKSETVDLDLTIDQAIQFVVSCGVVVPPQQQYQTGEAAAHVAERVAEHEAALAHEGERLPSSAAGDDQRRV